MTTPYKSLLFIVLLIVLGAPIIGQTTVITDDTNEANETYSTFPTDIDGDGDLDVLTASNSRLTSIAWHENLDGNGSFSKRRYIAYSPLNTYDVSAADFDGDGDMDVVGAWDGRISWLKNLDGQGDFGIQNSIAVGSGFRKVYPVDIDLDGDIDLVVAAVQSVFIYTNIDGEGTFEQRILQDDYFHYVAIGDLDGDQDPDILVSAQSSLNTPLTAYINDGVGVFDEAREIQIPALSGGDINLFDADGDNDLDVFVVLSGQNKHVWLANDGLGNFGGANLIEENEEPFRTAFGDLDLDGNNDLVISYLGGNTSTYWYKNQNGTGDFGPKILITNEAFFITSIHIEDFNQDASPDLLFSVFGNDEVVWFENINTGDSFEKQTPIANSADRANSALPRDIDGDGDLDILITSSGDDKVSWFENIDGLGNFGEQKVISNQANRVVAADAFDIDGDNNFDVVYAGASGGFIDYGLFWKKNADGLGNFGEAQAITLNYDNISDLEGADIDNDGDQDVVFSNQFPSVIGWIENTDGLGSFGTPIEFVVPTFLQPTDIHTTDMDGDGDLDIVQVNFQDSKLSWFENVDGNGQFSTMKIIVALDEFDPYFTSVHSGDLDGDGDIDIIASAIFEIRWFENLNGQGNFSEEGFIVNDTGIAGYEKIYVSDIDGDGDLDILSASERDDAIAFYENLDGLGNFSNRKTISLSTKDANFVIAADLDGDALNDVIGVSPAQDKVTWYTNANVLSIVDIDAPVTTIKIYPVPVQNILNIKSREKLKEVQIYTMAGQKVLSFYETNEINVSALPSAVYLVKIITITGSVINKKINKN